ncbi:protein of unknown function DUF1499 [Leptothrix cholodnii SP-6]|uniref:DUF1499 domain-containing protein n=1 Tax=Leptothrix cholodnii (strain ATCC 51168 / LMG 8142 / SP-6) TaxID=395495 RepID=B1Y1C3_LEPCP|nr:DUF1499 domain-containing protein [Leptothrix cholodnii]ACB34222.1 protein of unknown function DUF1499 [Leptothrix cholodnii SP-6]
MIWVVRLIMLGVGLTLLVLLAAQLGLFQGQAPGDLGVRDGRLKPPSRTPNSVSSQADLYPEHPQLAYARIEPLPMPGDARQTMARLQGVVGAMRGARIVEQKDDYLYARFTTPLMRYVDDVEFWLDPVAQVVQVRSASRLGHGDLGLNRKRVEQIRAALASP